MTNFQRGGPVRPSIVRIAAEHADEIFESFRNELSDAIHQDPGLGRAISRANRRVAAELFGIVSGQSDEAPGMTLDELLGDIDRLTEEPT